ncbi:MAG: DUF3110 domain-containing protein [Elainellaceae cyanobacterium]
MRVFVLLFNAGTDNEGIHTLRVGDRNLVLMFENEDDATRYGLMLEAQDLGSPSVEEFDADEIESFCDEANYESKFIETGTLAVPPEHNVESTDWNPEDDRMSEPSIQEKADTEPPELSNDELDRLRRQFEGLL